MDRVQKSRANSPEEKQLEVDLSMAEELFNSSFYIDKGNALVKYGYNTTVDQSSRKVLDANSSYCC
jgi:hypothetical protein